MVTIRPLASWSLDHVYAMYEAICQLPKSNVINIEELCTRIISMNTSNDKSKLHLLKDMSSDELNSFCLYILQRLGANKEILEYLMKDYEKDQTSDDPNKRITRTLNDFFFDTVRASKHVSEEESLDLLDNIDFDQIDFINKEVDLDNNKKDVEKSGRVLVSQNVPEEKKAKKVVQKVSIDTQTGEELFDNIPKHQTIKRKMYSETSPENKVVHIPVVPVNWKLNVVARFPNIDLCRLIRTKKKLTKMYNEQDSIEYSSIKQKPNTNSDTAFATIFNNIKEGVGLERLNDLIVDYI